MLSSVFVMVLTSAAITSWAYFKNESSPSYVENQAAHEKYETLEYTWGTTSDSSWQGGNPCRFLSSSLFGLHMLMRCAMRYKHEFQGCVLWWGSKRPCKGPFRKHLTGTQVAKHKHLTDCVRSRDAGRALPGHWSTVQAAAKTQGRLDHA